MQTGPFESSLTHAQIREQMENTPIDSWCQQLSCPEHTQSEFTAEGLKCAKRGVEELSALLDSHEFRDRFLNTQSHRETAEVHRVEDAIDEALIFKIKIRAEREERLAAGASLHKKEVKAAARLRNVVSYKSLTYDTSDRAQLLKLREAVAKDNAHYSQKRSSSLQVRATRIQHVNETYERLTREFEEMKEHPDFLRALEMWGRSRNAVGDRNGGRGYHAGVVHYFEYRAYSGKNKRYQNDNLDKFGIQGFIDFTNAVRHIVRPQKSASPEYGVLFRDEQNRKRLIARTESCLVIAFQHAEQPLRLLSIQPNKPGWQSREKVIERIKRELGPDTEDKRFNRLGKNRSLAACICSGEFLLP